ncbi:DUF6119 family protein [Parablautia sp. Marseille-Q6255]|uniref:DUF6119 family protein n=1 Tax=Parablautia sp. Marseille-Q6255 TaxID=3039593 RepID=UPI0024BD58F0|nr:DUF6119 family protein [Parablautia sp. Marseille-Q6255]
MSGGEGIQFSIYKIDYQEVKKQHTVTLKETEPTYAVDMCCFLLEEIKKKISQKENPDIWNVEHESFRGIIYRTYHHPAWEEMAKDLLMECLKDENQVDSLMLNVNVSYVLFYVNNNCIYVMTGGYGSHLIKKYIEKNWGLHLMPKLVKSDAGVIRQLKENNLFGNTSSMSKANRKTTNITLEQDMSTIFRELSVEVDQNIGSKMGIVYSEEVSVNRKTSVILKDSLVLRKHLTLSELKKVIEAIERVEKETDNFSLGYFIQAKKRGIKTSELLDELINHFIDGKYDNFQLVGDDYLAYYTSASEYTLTTEAGEIYYSASNPIELSDIFETFKENEKKVTKSFLINFLKKWKICSQDSSGEFVLYPITIMNSIQGFIEYGAEKIPCYIFQGQWYCMDEKYKGILQSEFDCIYDGEYEKVKEIKAKFGLCKSGLTEDRYNNDFYENDNIIVGHKALISNFEIADLFFWDSENIYLMCNKYHFDGSGSRDLTNQIRASADFLQHQLASLQKSNFIKALYKKIEELYVSKKKTIPIKEEDFENMFNSKRICYIAGYIEGFRKETDSLYAKYLTVDLNKKMHEKGFMCISMGIGD